MHMKETACTGCKHPTQQFFLWSKNLHHFFGPELHTDPEFTSYNVHRPGIGGGWRDNSVDADKEKCEKAHTSEMVVLRLSIGTG
jgi:hypothetical protein